MLLEAIGIMLCNGLALGLTIAGGFYVISLIYRVVQAARHMHRLEREYVAAERASWSEEDPSRPQDKAAVTPPLAPYRFDQDGT